MWIDYAIYLTTGIVVLAGISLIVVGIQNRGSRGMVIGLTVLLVIGIVATALVAPERFRQPGEDLQVVEVDGGFQAEVSLVGQCLSIFRRFGPVSFITGSDFFPGGDWDRGPSNGCEAVGHMDADIYLPSSVDSGDWVLCDHSFCHRLMPPVFS
jgi:hypothetical protein